MQRGIWAGEQLQALLRERGMTQEQLGRAAGLRRTDINRYVRNKQRLGERNAARLAAALDVTVEELGFTPNDGPVENATLEALARLEARVEALVELLERREAEGG